MNLRALYRNAMFAVSALLLPNPALAVTEQVTGLSVDAPASFTAAVVNPHPPNVAALISLKSSFGDECGVTFREASANASLAQDELNAFAIKPEMKNLTKASFQVAFDLNGDGDVFNVSGVAGLEFLGKIKEGSRQAGMPLYLATMQTPKGVLLLTCLSSPARFESLLPQFREIRDSIKPPR